MWRIRAIAGGEGWAGWAAEKAEAVSSCSESILNFCEDLRRAFWPGSWNRGVPTATFSTPPSPPLMQGCLNRSGSQIS